MTDREFDLLLQEDLSQLPPAPEVVSSVNPWRKAFRRILWGFALNNITVHFAALQYILPTVGMILLLLGFRTLRRENGYFKAGWVLTIIVGVHRLLSLAVSATIWNSTFAASTLCQVLNHIVFAVTLAQILCLRAGLRAVQRKAGLEPRTRSATALAVWYFMILPLSLLSGLGTLLAIPMIAAYIFIIICLWKLSKVPEDSGYAMKAAPVRLSDGRFAALCCGILAVLMAVGLIFFHQHPMEFAPAPEITQEEAIADLSELAIPEHILRDLTDEDLAACMGAKRMVIYEHDEEFPDGGVLRTTLMALELSGQERTWKFIHHFRWTTPPGHFGTELIQLWTTYNSIEGWFSDAVLTGRVLYDKHGKTLTAPYYSLGPVTYTTNSTFFGQQQQTAPLALFSFPRGGENYRCYVAYDAYLFEYEWLANSYGNYVHQFSPIQYPVQTACEYLITRNMFRDSLAFRYITEQLMFRPVDEQTVHNFGDSKWRDRGPGPEGYNSSWYSGEKKWK